MLICLETFRSTENRVSLSLSTEIFEETLLRILGQLNINLYEKIGIKYVDLNIQSFFRLRYNVIITVKEN